MQHSPADAVLSEMQCLRCSIKLLYLQDAAGLSQYQGIYNRQADVACLIFGIKVCCCSQRQRVQRLLEEAAADEVEGQCHEWERGELQQSHKNVSNQSDGSQGIAGANRNHDADALPTVSEQAVV